MRGHGETWFESLSVECQFLLLQRKNKIVAVQRSMQRVLHAFTTRQCDGSAQRYISFGLKLISSIVTEWLFLQLSPMMKLGGRLLIGLHPPVHFFPTIVISQTRLIRFEQTVQQTGFNTYWWITWLCFLIVTVIQINVCKGGLCYYLFFPRS